MVREYLRKILVGALNGRMRFFFDLAFCRDCPWRMGFLIFFCVSVDLQCYTSRKGVLLDKRKWFQFRRFKKIWIFHFNLSCL